MRYPETPRGDVVENLHGHEVADPYRWLEEPDSEATCSWVEQQRTFTEAELAKLPERQWFQDTMARIVSTPRAYAPSRKSGWYLFSRGDGVSAQPRVYGARSLDAAEAGGDVIFDPNTWSEDGTTSLQAWSVSRDGRYCAYAVSEAGSDWQHVHVMELATGTVLDDTLITKFSGLSWLPDNESFIYVRRQIDKADGTNTQALPPGDLVIHRLGTPVEEDELVWANPGDPMLFAHATASSDGRWLIGAISWGTEAENSVWMQPLTLVEGRTVLGGRIEVLPERTMGANPVDVVDSRLVLHTDDVPHGRVVTCELIDSAPLTELIAEGEWPIEHVDLALDTLVVCRLEDVSPAIDLYGLDGSWRRRLDIPGGALVGLSADADSDELLISMTSVTEPVATHVVSAATGDARRIQLLPTGSEGFRAPEITIERRRATSADGTEVPYFLICRADHDLSVPTPTLVYGYGGFNVAVAADYRPGFAGWLAAGGVLAIANLRGGSEFGRDWYDGGRGPTKQHVFDDVIAVGEHLQATGVAGEDHLVVHGRSNGGLLAGAALVQRPDLWQVALPVVGVLDVLRFHRFTGGLAWASDYGNPDVAEDFEVALAYSPVHNVQPGTHYPATLIATGDHDDRVVPLHSYKFAATLQAAQVGDAPVLLRIEQATGHGMGKPVRMVGEEWADLLAFAAHHAGLQLPA